MNNIIINVLKAVLRVLPITTAIFTVQILFILRDQHYQLALLQKQTQNSTYISNDDVLFRLSKLESEVDRMLKAHRVIGLYSKEYLFNKVYATELEQLKSDKAKYEANMRRLIISIQAEEENLLARKNVLSNIEYTSMQNNINKKRVDLDNVNRIQERNIQVQYEQLESKFDKKLEQACSLLYAHNPMITNMLSLNSGISMTPNIVNEWPITFIEITDQLFALM